MDYTALVIQHNREMRDALQLILDNLNQGQQKKLLKEEKVKAMLTRYGVVTKDTE